MNSEDGQRNNSASGKVLLFILILCLTGASCQSRIRQTITPSPPVPTTAQTTSIPPNSQPSTPPLNLVPSITLTPLQSLTESTGTVEATAQVTQTSSSPTPSSSTDTPTPTLPTAPCELAQELTPIQEAIRVPGESFTHIWRLRNIGTCTWSNKYTLAWSSGEPYDSPLTIEIGASVAPGEVVELNVPMLAPGIIGDYLGVWAFLNSQGWRVDIAARPDDLLSLRMRVQINRTPSATVTTGTIVGRVIRNGTPVQAGTAILLENQIYNTLMSATTNQDGKFTFNNIPVSNLGYNVVFSQELNPQYSYGQVVSWAWLGPIPLTIGELENLPDLEIDPLGLKQSSPVPNAVISAATISTSSPLRFEWQSYPLATSYWVNLTRGDRQFSVWVSGFTNATSVLFDGTLSDNTRIQNGEFWWGVGAQRPVSGYTLTVFSAMIPLAVIP